ncbi:integrating conjugative element protein [Vibrio cyclitrophicus]
MNRRITLITLLLLLSSHTLSAADLLQGMVPVSTTQLTPGKVERRVLKQSVSTPLFIVGDDALSHRWLSAKRDYLASIGAQGLVVNVKTKAGWQRFKRYDLTFYPVAGRDFAAAFGLRHYPALIERGELKQ